MSALIAVALYVFGENEKLLKNWQRQREGHNGIWLDHFSWYK